MDKIQLYNYWEHIKAEKDLAFVLPPTDEKRVRIHKAAEEILMLINERNPETSVATVDAQ